MFIPDRDIKTAYRIIRERSLPEFTFGEFVKIHKILELDSDIIPIGDSTNLPSIVEKSPVKRVLPEIDYCGLFVCPFLKNNTVNCLIVTVSNKEEIVPIEQIESWLEPINRNTSFFNRSTHLQQYFQTTIESIHIREVQSPYWELKVRYRYGSTLIERLRETKIPYGIPYKE